MTRSADDPAVDVLARAIADRTEDAGRSLIVGDPGETLADVLGDAARWDRHATGAGTATAFPPDGPFDTVALRLPKGRESLRMALHWLGARLAPGGRLWLAGANDEGVRSARTRLEEVFTDVEDVDARRHCRVYRAGGPRPDLLGAPEPWLESFDAGDLRWQAWPGTFAHGRIDDGTALLISTLPQIAGWEGDPLRRVLDLGCGVGILGLAIRRLRPDGALDLVDHDALAVEAAQRNLPGASAWVSDGLARYPGSDLPLVMSNPPFHAGVATALGLPARLMAETATRIARGGSVVAVVPRTIAPQGLFPAKLGRPELLAEDGRYRVWRARRTS